MNDLDQEGEIVIKQSSRSGEENVEDVVIVKEEEDIFILNKILCRVCGAEFLHEDDLEKHRENENCTEVTYYCLMCGDHFESEDSLDAHRKQHPDDEACTYGVNFTIEKDKDQENVDSNEKDCWIISCVLCGEKFASKALLNSHLIENHSEAKVFESEPSQLSSGEERYHCQLCPRSFTRIGSLNYHVSRKHFGTGKERDASEFPYLCNECGNRYKSGTQLCRHRRWECGKEPMFKCQLCIKKFHHRHGLKQHIRLHLAKRGQVGTTAQFCCEKCGRGYKLKSSLNNHMKWECGKEPIFVCTICTVRFTHKGNLKKHMLTKHGDNVQHTTNYV